MSDDRLDEAIGPIAFGLVVPTLNECPNVEPLLERIEAALKSVVWEVIFVDDGSTDGTPELVERLALVDRRVRLIQRVNRTGLSSAVTDGMMATAAPIVGVIDGDLQHDAAILPALIEHVANNQADIAIGSRYCQGGGTQDWPLPRRIGSKVANALGNLIIGTPSTDPMSGYFVVRRKCVVDALPRLSGIGFKILIDLMASSVPRLRVAEVPYVFQGRVAGESKMGSAVILDYMLLLVDKTIGRILPTRFVLFMMVGALGVLVHLTILALLMELGVGFTLAQAGAVSGAILFNFTLNNLLTYRDRRLKGVRYFYGLASFAAVCSVGAFASVGVGTFVFSLDKIWWAAGLAGIATSALWNYSVTSFVTWRKK